jgi:hypothetical protein
MARRYRAPPKRDNAAMLVELCALIGRQGAAVRARAERVARKRQAASAGYGPEVIVALRRVWALRDALAGKRLEPFVREIVERLRGHDESMRTL